jgi:hypothetical protein
MRRLSPSVGTLPPQRGSAQEAAVAASARTVCAPLARWHAARISVRLVLAETEHAASSRNVPLDCAR